MQSRAKSIIKTANLKLSALSRVGPFVTDFKTKVSSSIIVPYSGCLGLEVKP